MYYIQSVRKISSLEGSYLALEPENQQETLSVWSRVQLTTGFHFTQLDVLFVYPKEKIAMLDSWKARWRSLHKS